MATLIRITPLGGVDSEEDNPQISKVEVGLTVEDFMGTPCADSAFGCTNTYCTYKFWFEGQEPDFYCETHGPNALITLLIPVGEHYNAYPEFK